MNFTLSEELLNLRITLYFVLMLKVEVKESVRIRNAVNGVLNRSKAIYGCGWLRGWSSYSLSPSRCCFLLVGCLRDSAIGVVTGKILTLVQLQAKTKKGKVLNEDFAVSSPIVPADGSVSRIRKEVRKL